MIGKKRKSKSKGPSKYALIAPPPGQASQGAGEMSFRQTLGWDPDHVTAGFVQPRQGRSQLNLAISAEQLELLTQYAKRRHIPVSTLARAWLLERLEIELGSEN